MKMAVGAQGASLLITVFCGIGTVAGFLGDALPFLEVASNFRLQYLWGLGLAAMVLAVYRKLGVAVIAGLLALTNLAVIVPFYIDPVLATHTVKEHTYRAVLLNLNQSNRHFDAVLGLIQETDPDMIMLLEVSRRWAKALQKLQSDYPFNKTEVRRDPGGIAFMSRIPTTKIELTDFGIRDRPVLLAGVNLDDQPLMVVGLHPYAGRDSTKARLRQQQLTTLAQFVNTQTAPVIVLADLNLTPWSPQFHNLLRTSHLRDGRQGFGLNPTWPAQFPLLWLPIDHCLVSPEIVIQKFRTGPAVGSDHYPVIVDFRFQVDTPGL